MGLRNGETPPDNSWDERTQFAWKAFRIGVIASGRSFPLHGQDAKDYWRMMRARFVEWYASRLRPELVGITKEPARQPFNGPRVRELKKRRA